MNDSFAIIARPRTAADEMPPPARGVVVKGPGPDYDGANPDLSRHAGAHVGKMDFWVVPGNDTICLVASAGQGGGGGCTPTRFALAGGYSHITGGTGFGTRPDDMVVYGLAHDGIDTVTLALSDGTREVPVVDNVWAAAADVTATGIVTVGGHRSKIEGPGPLPGSG
jgi:hypothetical protein